MGLPFFEMEVKLAKTLGFCFGVKRALELTEKALQERPCLHMLGALIHNKAVVERLAQSGLDTVKTLDEVKSGTVVIRAHGVTRDVYEEAAKREIELIDATCPFVKKAQDAASLLVKEGYAVLLVGDKNHAEVRGIVSAAGGPVHVVANIDEIPKLTRATKVGLLFQTTKRPELARLFFDTLLERVQEIRVINTICRATIDRQLAVSELAPQVSAMVIVGDPESANTARLTAIAKETNERTIQVENASQLETSFFAGCTSVGLCAGASTPHWLIDEVKSFLEAL